jgi:hypothetical protein
MHGVIHVQFISQRRHVHPSEGDADRTAVLRGVCRHQLFCQRTARQQLRPHQGEQTGSYGRQAATSQINFPGTGRSGFPEFGARTTLETAFFGQCHRPRRRCSQNGLGSPPALGPFLYAWSVAKSSGIERPFDARQAGDRGATRSRGRKIALRQH